MHVDSTQPPSSPSILTRERERERERSSCISLMDSPLYPRGYRFYQSVTVQGENGEKLIEGPIISHTTGQLQCFGRVPFKDDSFWVSCSDLKDTKLPCMGTKKNTQKTWIWWRVLVIYFAYIYPGNRPWLAKRQSKWAGYDEGSKGS